MDEIDILEKNRNYLLVLVSKADEKQLTEIPEGFKTNILWNMGHILVTQQMLHYFLSRKPMNIPKLLRKQLQIETSPAEWESPPDITQIKELLVSTVDRLKTDYQAGIFTEYKEFVTMTGYRLNNIDKAIAFNNFHEGYHSGIIHSLLKLTGVNS